MKISRITLGTAQLGMNYGVSNRNGKPGFDTSLKILKYSWKHGINTFDTAPAYGNSEKIIGKFISSELNNMDNVVVISKLPQIKINKEISFNNIYSYIKEQVNRSLINLNLKKIPIYLLHHYPDIFLGDGIIIDCLNQIKREGLIDRFGISIYNPIEVETSLKYKEINVIQVPINIFDHRLIETRLLNKLHKKNYIILARSVFLQGLFFISPTKLKKNMKFAKNSLIKLNQIARDYNINKAALAFLFVRDLPQISSLVIGAESILQIKENMKLLNEKPFSEEINKVIYENFHNLPEKLINPHLWNK